MAYYKVRIEVWCDWNPAESDLEDIAQSMGVGEAICTMREVVAVVKLKPFFDLGRALRERC